MVEGWRGGRAKDRKRGPGSLVGMGMKGRSGYTQRDRDTAKTSPLIGWWTIVGDRALVSSWLVRMGVKGEREDLLFWMIGRSGWEVVCGERERF